MCACAVIEQAGKGCEVDQKCISASFSSVCTARVGAPLKSGTHTMRFRVDTIGGGFVAAGVCTGNYKLDRPPNKRGAYTLLSNNIAAKNGTMIKANHLEWVDRDMLKLTFDADQKKLCWWRNGEEGNAIDGIKDSGVYFCLGGSDGAKLTLVEKKGEEGAGKGEV